MNEEHNKNIITEETTKPDTKTQEKTKRKIIALVVVAILCVVILGVLLYDDEAPPVKMEEIELNSYIQHKYGYPGESIGYNFSIYNPNSDPDSIFLLASGLPSNWEVLYPSNMTVDGKELKDQDFSVVPPSSAALNGTYPFRLIVTSTNMDHDYFLEYNVTVLRTHGVDIICHESSLNIVYGRSVSYKLIVNNTGNAEDNITLSHNVTHLPDFWELSFGQATLHIPALSSASVTCNITAPLNSSEGRYDIGVTATSSSGISDMIWLNSTLIIVLKTDAPNKLGYPGEEISFNFTIRNPENIPDNYSVNISGLPDDWVIEFPTVVSISGSAVNNVKFNIITSTDIYLNRTYPFILKTTSHNTNHTYFLNFYLTIPPMDDSETVSTDTPNLKGYPGEKIFLNLTIINHGNASDNYSVQVSGLPSDWTVISVGHISVNGSSIGQGKVGITPSLTTALNATYSFVLNVTSQATNHTWTLECNMTVYQTFGIEIVCYNDLHDADAGRFTEFAVVINNTGNGDDMISFSYNYLPQNWTVSSESDPLLVPGLSSVIMIVNITTDHNTSKEQYDIEIVAESSGGMNTSTWLKISLLKDFENETVEAGDKIQVDYIGWSTDGLLIDTSLEEIAKNDSIPKAEGFVIRPSYFPLKMYVGSPDPEPSDDYLQVIDGFWEEVIGMEVNETRVVRIPPEKAYNDGRWWIFEIIVVSVDG